MSISHRELLALAEDVVAEAGRYIVRDRPDRLAVAATKSSPTDVVTEMDRGAEALVAARLTAARPDDGILGEEGAAHPGTSGVTWVVDPIDGTVNYLYDLPAYAVSVAARVGEQVVAGVVANPASGETWTALRGEGAWLDGRRLEPHRPPGLDLALVATGFGYERHRRARQAEVLRDVLPKVRDIRRMGAASLDLCALATGRVDGYYEQGLKPWDLAAGGLVAEETGVVVTGLRGARAGEALVVAAREPLVRDLVALLESLDADAEPFDRD